MKTLVGKKFGRLEVLFRLPNEGNYSVWKCRCDCGAEISALGCKLTGGRKKSCGCLIDEARKKVLTTHGLSKTRAYAAHHSMMTRCYDPKCDSYERYGGAGITVAAEWHDPVKFFQDMGECPPGMTLDRLENSKGYEPGNCRWATRLEQASHKTNNVYLLLKGEKFSVAQAARNFKVNAATLAWRLRNKKSISDLIPGASAYD